MSLLSAIINRFRNDSSGRRVPTEPAAAYDLWAPTYDAQPGNLMLHLDEIIFARLLAQLDLRDKTVVDIGCGTGRHWGQILKQRPADLVGYDVSPEMLKRLHEKYPEARAWLLRGETLDKMKQASADVMVSALALAHIENLEGALKEWNRILRRTGAVVITDYHSAAFEKGADRTFRHNNELISIRNYIHPIKDLRLWFKGLGWEEEEFVEMKIDETMKRFYEQQNALHVYRRFYDTPLIYGWRLRKA